MKKSRVLALGLTAALSVSLLAGCGTGDTQTTPAPEGSTPVETGTTGAANELNVCFASEPETMDPSMNRTVDGNVMITHLFEGLYKWVDSDPSGRRAQRCYRRAGARHGRRGAHCHSE